MILKFVTITGVDTNSDIDRIIKITKKYPFVEWGILISASKNGEPRYPDKTWIERFRFALRIACGLKVGQYYTPNISFHICGKLSRDLLMGKREEIWNKYVPTLSSAKRIQLNFNLKNSKLDLEEFLKLIITNFSNSNISVITQHNQSNYDFWQIMLKAPDVKHNILFDSSGGRGIESIFIPKSINGIFCGYSGGFGPDNIEEYLKKLNNYNGNYNIGTCWIDMETNVRTDNKLDLDKVEFVLEKSKPYTIWS
jgi:hypothetical protein